jgi:hypothetical protein
VVPYLCSRFHIFDRPVLEKYVSQVKGGLHLLQSCLRVVRDGLLRVAREMHLSFESLIITNAPGLQVSLMDFHHDTSLRSILEDDSISLAFRAHICSCLGKGAKLWLVARPFIRSLCITHFTFTSMLRFCLGFIQPSASNLFMCECEHKLDTSSTHLTRCPFVGQWITTHDTI